LPPAPSTGLPASPGQIAAHLDPARRGALDCLVRGVVRRHPGARGAARV